jgi:SAM-dependent methyltransferase
MAVTYDKRFFDYVDQGAVRSAAVLISHLYPSLLPTSVLDVGCGRGGWLRAWREAGCGTILGVDGGYIDRQRIHVAPEEFKVVDLAERIDLERGFDLVQCLEVAEHVPGNSAATLIDSITCHGDLVLFSAAQPGQGGTQHVNEQPLEYWRDMFGARGYHAYDCIRPLLHADIRIEPWYRYNTILYANSAGQERLPESYRETEVPDHATFRDFAPLSWRIRCAVFRRMPVSVVDEVARLNAMLKLFKRDAPGNFRG